MQLFVRGCSSSGTVVVEASPDSTLGAVKAAYALKVYRTALVEPLVLLWNSKQLDDDATLKAVGLEHGATLSACSRLLGGGGDGGSTGAESRSCYLEMYAEKKPDKVNPAEELLARATRCRLSGERLAPPCVADELGSLFNKEALVHALLNKTMPAALSHISSLKSVVNLKLDPVPHTAAAAAVNGSKASAAGPGPGSGKSRSSSSTTADFQCPVTGLELNGRFPFVIHRPSGVVISDRALREVPAAAVELLGGKWTQDDLIPLNPAREELEKRQQQLAVAVAAERARKKLRKAEKLKDKAAESATAGAEIIRAAAAAVEDGQSAGNTAYIGSKRAVPVPSVGGIAAAVAADVAVKKVKVPEGATPSVYASIFNTGQPKVKETFLCRSTAGRGLGM